MTHQKRIAVSKHWPIKRKGIKFITNSSPGTHKKTVSIPLNIVLKNMLKITKTTRETKKVLNDKNILIDNVVKKDHRFPVGFLDIITLKKINKTYMMVYDDVGNLKLKEQNPKYKKPYKIINKKMLKGKRLQLNFFNGKNILVNKGDYKVGDTIILENNKVVKHFKFEKGQKVFLTGGKHIGAQGVIEDIKQQSSEKNKIVVIKTSKGKFETLKNYAFVTGETI